MFDIVKKRLLYILFSRRFSKHLFKRKKDTTNTMDARIVLPSIPNPRDRLEIRRSFFPEYPERDLWTGTTVRIDEETFDDLIEGLVRVDGATKVIINVRRRHRSWAAAAAEIRASNLLAREFSSKNIEIHFPRECDDRGLNYVRLSHSDSPQGSCEAHGEILRALVPTKVSGMLLNVDDVAFAIANTIVLDDCWIVIFGFIPTLVRSVDVIDGRIVRMRFPLNPDVTSEFVRATIEASGVVPSVVESYVIEHHDDGMAWHYFRDSTSVLHVVFAADASATLDHRTLLTVWGNN